eukprot:scaffold994_cov226-Prasinococcus_capsulatus_cf.AAC.13
MLTVGYRELSGWLAACHTRARGLQPCKMLDGDLKEANVNNHHLLVVHVRKHVLIPEVLEEVVHADPCPKSTHRGEQLAATLRSRHLIAFHHGSSVTRATLESAPAPSQRRQCHCASAAHGRLAMDAEEELGKDRSHLGGPGQSTCHRAS